MIKKFYEITIRDYNIIEQSGSIAHLRKFNWIPVLLLSKLILKEVEKVNKLLNASEDNDTDELKWQVESLAKIAAIQANVLGLFNLLKLGNVVDIFKAELKPQYKRKIKLNNENVKTYIKNLSDYTGYKVETLEDLVNVVKELEFRKDKYNENFNRPQKQPGKVYLMQVVLGVFSYLNQPVNVDMTISEFVILRNEANERLMKEKTK